MDSDPAATAQDAGTANQDQAAIAAQMADDAVTTVPSNEPAELMPEDSHITITALPTEPIETDEPVEPVPEPPQDRSPSPSGNRKKRKRSTEAIEIDPALLDTGPSSRFVSPPAMVAPAPAPPPDDKIFRGLAFYVDVSTKNRTEILRDIKVSQASVHVGDFSNQLTIVERWRYDRGRLPRRHSCPCTALPRQQGQMGRPRRDLCTPGSLVCLCRMDPTVYQWEAATTRVCPLHTRRRAGCSHRTIRSDPNRERRAERRGWAEHTADRLDTTGNRGRAVGRGNRHHHHARVRYNGQAGSEGRSTQGRVPREEGDPVSIIHCLYVRVTDERSTAYTLRNSGSESIAIGQHAPTASAAYRQKKRPRRSRPWSRRR